jgi:hypothetical protein
MSTPVKLYQQELHKNIGYFATWLPSDALDLGDVGVFQGGRFHKVASLRELGIPAKPGATGSPQTMNYSSTESTTIGGTATGDVAGAATAEVSVKFGRQGSFVFQAVGVRSVQLADKLETGARIVSAFERGAWKKEWLLVDSVYAADSATIIVSEDESAEIVLKASSALPLGSLPLADPKLGLTVSSTRGKLVYVIAGNGLHPLYSCLRVSKTLFSAPAAVPVRGAATSPTDATAQQLAYASIEELIDS